MADGLPFIITIDTEGDHLWSRPKVVRTENGRYVDRFQTLCEKYGFKPVWLTNWEVAQDDRYIEKLARWQNDGKAEVGMHLHAWNSPPIVDLTGNDDEHQPYLIEYPDAVMEDKIGEMTRILEAKTGKKPVSHRAGRWATDERYFSLLAKFGYKVDCSVTPHVNWAPTKGSPSGHGGSDYTGYSEKAYTTPQGILEVPMTIRFVQRGELARDLRRLPGLFGKVGRRLFPVHRWLRPNGRNLKDMLRLVDEAKVGETTHLEMMLHSSELMPAGSPYFKSARSIETLFDHCDRLFERVAQTSVGMTLEEFYAKDKTERLKKESI